MKILYITNIPVPYRVEFFRQLAGKVDLTVVYEQRADGIREESWLKSGMAGYQAIYCDDYGALHVSEQVRFIRRIIAEESYDLVVVGCYNTVLGMTLLTLLRQWRQRYVVNIDGKLFTGSGLKKAVRNWLISGADGYLIAGDKSAKDLRCILGEGVSICSYPFSSLTEQEVLDRSSAFSIRDQKLVLSVGQYEDYKGLDILLESATSLRDAHFCIVGMGKKQAEFDAMVKRYGLSNVETTSFLPPDELAALYEKAGLFVLPSRQECWGLVINEAAACGCPIVSTMGSGAAIEFLEDGYPQYLAEPNSVESLTVAIRKALTLDYADKRKYSNYLIATARKYTIERCVEAHARFFQKLCGVEGTK